MRVGNGSVSLLGTLSHHQPHTCILMPVHIVIGGGGALKTQSKIPKLNTATKKVTFKDTNESNLHKAPIRVASRVPPKNAGNQQQKNQAIGSHIPIPKDEAHKTHVKAPKNTRGQANATEKPSSTRDMGGEAGLGLSRGPTYTSFLPPPPWK